MSLPARLALLLPHLTSPRPAKCFATLYAPNLAGRRIPALSPCRGKDASSLHDLSETPQQVLLRFSWLQYYAHLVSSPPFPLVTIIAYGHLCAALDRSPLLGREHEPSLALIDFDHLQHLGKIKRPRRAQTEPQPRSPPQQVVSASRYARPLPFVYRLAAVNRLTRHAIS